MVTSYSRYWPLLFPQHGPGKEHERRIMLVPWQQDIVDTHPWEFIRGLIHSDGCRITNWTTRVDQVGVDWRLANARNISIARKASVALLDTHVGPKY